MIVQGLCVKRTGGGTCPLSGVLLAQPWPLPAEERSTGAGERHNGRAGKAGGSDPDFLCGLGEATHPRAAGGAGAGLCPRSLTRFSPVPCLQTLRQTIPVCPRFPDAICPFFLFLRTSFAGIAREDEGGYHAPYLAKVL